MVHLVKYEIICLKFFLGLIVMFIHPVLAGISSNPILGHPNTGCFFHWYPPKKLNYGKPRLGESTLTPYPVFSWLVNMLYNISAEHVMSDI